jgi:putative cardiolipin synthase
MGRSDVRGTPVHRRYRPLLLGACALALVLALLHGCTTRPLETLPVSRALLDTAHSRLGELSARAIGALGQQGQDQGSAVHLLSDGLEALAARRALIARADRSLDVQYYIWRSDVSGTSLAADLWNAAERGVRVRLLLDDWGARPSEEALGVLASHPNVEIRLFNPLAAGWSQPLALLLDFDRGNRRMHNKLLLADNQAAIVGGRNIGDEYFEGRAGLQFGDLDVLALGPVVRQASAGFDRFWNHPYVRRVPARPQAALPAAHAPPAALEAPWSQADATPWALKLDSGQLEFRATLATALQDDPLKAEGSVSTQDPRPNLGTQIASLVGQVESDLLLVSPYFVPGEGGVAQLRALREAGVRVRVVTNSLAATDVPAVHSGYARYRRPLLEAGIELYEIKVEAPLSRRPSTIRSLGSSRVSLHAKLMVLDQRSTFVGSMNIDPRSLRLNTENGIVLNSASLAAEISGGIERQLASTAYRVELSEGQLRWASADPDGRPVHHDAEPRAGWWLRLQATVMSWLPIEGLL